MKLSEMLSSQVICLAEAKPLGTIISATCDYKMKGIKQVVVADREENEGYLQLRYLNKGDGIYYTLYQAHEYEQRGLRVPFQRNIYNTDGMYIGRLCDVEVEGSEIIALLTSDDKSITAADVVVAGGELVIVKGNKKLRVSKGRKKSVKKSIIDIEDAFNTPNLTPRNMVEGNSTMGSVVEAKRIIPENNDTPSSIPMKIISSYAFLLGRKVVKKVLHNGDVLIPEGRIIDTETVELARDNGKLVELTVSSKETN